MVHLRSARCGKKLDREPSAPGIGLRSAHAVTVRIVDIAGKEISVYEHALALGTNDVLIPTVSLTPGTYYVIAEWNGRQYAKKLQVIQ